MNKNKNKNNNYNMPIHPTEPPIKPIKEEEVSSEMINEVVSLCDPLKAVEESKKDEPVND